MTFWKHSITQYFCLLALSLASASALAFNSHTAEYEVFWGDRSVAHLAVDTAVTDADTVIVSKLKAHGIASAVMPGVRTQTSKFINTADGLEQQSLLATRTKRVKVGKNGSRQTEATMNTIEFDHANGSAIATEGKDTATLDVSKRTSDRQSLILLVAQRWKAATQAERDAGIEYDFVNGTGKRTYLFKTMREETLETDVGTFTAVKLVHGSEDDKHTVVWLAKELDYYPVGFDKARPRSKGVSVITRISELPAFK
jgi:hypothetical protein